jgi:hypothetical protein
MALPYGTTGSLTPAFAPARPVSLAVKPPYAFALDGWFPLSLRGPSRASVTFWEATAPVKLPTMQCPAPGLRASVRSQDQQGWYFKVGSIEASAPTSKPPTYPTHAAPNSNAKL